MMLYCPCGFLILDMGDYKTPRRISPVLTTMRCSRCHGLIQSVPPSAEEDE